MDITIKLPMAPIYVHLSLACGGSTFGLFSLLLFRRLTARTSFCCPVDPARCRLCRWVWRMQSVDVVRNSIGSQVIDEILEYVHLAWRHVME
jgi:hypothetical protein